MALNLISRFSKYFVFFILLLLKTPISFAEFGHGSKPIYDMHVHFACVEEKNDCYVHPDFRQHWKYSVYMQALGVTQNDVDTKGDTMIVERLFEKISHSQTMSKAIVLAIDGVYDRKTGELDKAKTQVKFSNHYLFEKTKDNKSVLMGVSINPFSKNALQELEWAKKNGAVLVKWIPCIMDFSPDEKDEKLTAFYKKLIELKLPLLSHTGNEGTFLHSKDEYCNPEALRVPLKMGVTVIAAHLSSKGEFQAALQGGEGNSKMETKQTSPPENSPKKMRGIDLIYKLMKEYPHLYVDISAVTQINRYNHLEFAKPLLATHRVLYGSDWPLISAQLMGLPLVNWRYYGFQLDGETIKLIKSSENDFDKDVFLKKGLGIPESVFIDTANFFNGGSH